MVCGKRGRSLLPLQEIGGFEKGGKNMKKQPETFSNYCLGPDRVCPECGSENYKNIEDWEDDGDKAWVAHQCNSCKAKFDSVFVFVYTAGYREIRGKLVEG
jgi:hypothetical protein